MSKLAALVIVPWQAAWKYASYPTLCASLLGNVKQRKAHLMTLFGSDISRNGIHASIFRSLVKERMLIPRLSGIPCLHGGHSHTLTCGLEWVGVGWSCMIKALFCHFHR